MRNGVRMIGHRLYKLVFRIPNVTLLVFRVRCGALNSNQSKEYECVMEFPMIYFNILM